MMRLNLFCGKPISDKLLFKHFPTCLEGIFKEQVILDQVEAEVPKPTYEFIIWQTMTNVDTGNIFFSVEPDEQPLSYDWLLTVPHSWHLTSNPSNTQLFQLTASLAWIAIISPTVCVMSANPPPPHISHKTQVSGIVGAVTRPAHFNWITFILVLLRNPVNPLSRLFLINTHVQCFLLNQISQTRHWIYT